jgi:hypothetical protein
MPNTLGVGADPASLCEPLFSGFAEDLFSAVPRLIHSLDVTAEDTDSDSYRDLLREIDRAFQSFDHMAVRHGWLSGGEGSGPSSLEPCAAIDLVAFVKSVLTQESNGYRVPPAWAQDLDGLPGFDKAAGLVRLTADRDEDSLARMFPGRSHPLTRRAIAAVRTGRVSAARGQTLSLLMTYAVDAGSLLRTVFTLLLSPDGSISERTDLLSIAESPASSDGTWPLKFASWAPDAIAAAIPCATKIAERIGSAAAAAHQERIEQAVAATRAWLAKRTVELCGPPRPATADLFDPQPADDGWRFRTDPEQRLAAFAADPSMSLSERREAATILARSTAKPKPFPRTTLTTLGMLMLVP